MPKSMSHLSNESIFLMCTMKVPDALEERLVREIMVIDQIEHADAKKKVSEMATEVKTTR